MVPHDGVIIILFSFLVYLSEDHQNIIFIFYFIKTCFYYSNKLFKKKIIVQKYQKKEHIIK
jgi:hypothetical protein